MLHKGDKIKLVKAIGNFGLIGEEFDVTDVSEDGLISFNCEFGAGMMTFLEYRGYFELVEKKKMEWTEWKKYFTEDGAAVLCKTNRKVVKVKYNGIVTKATCCDSDTFDLETGIEIAFLRAKIKLLGK